MNQSPMSASRTRIRATVVTFAVLAACVSVATTPDDSARAAAPRSTEPAPVPEMGSYPLQSYAAQASAVPAELSAAIARDLDLTAAEYLAGADAADDATIVVEALTDRGVEVLGYSLEGTTLVVNVSSSGDVPLVEESGAVATVGEPESRDFSGLDLPSMNDVRGGMAYLSGDGQNYFRCSVGFTGRTVGAGSSAFATAGHCEGSSNTYYENPQRWADDDGTFGSVMGSGVPGSFSFGDGDDVGVVNISGAGFVAKPEILTWSGGSGAPTSAPLVIRDQIAAVVGAAMCKSGSTTGWTCGWILAVDQLIYVDGNFLVNTIISDACMLPGDSGGSAIIGASAIGINSAGNWENSCDPAANPGAITAYFPMVSAAGWESVTQRQAGVWELSTKVEKPSVAVPATNTTIFQVHKMSGSVPSGGVRHTVKAYFDGQSVPRTAVVGANGAWEIDLTGLSLGAHTYTIKTTWGTMSESATLSGAFTIAPTPAVDRIQGADRYQVSVEISKVAFPEPTDAEVVYIATGNNYPDALSAAPAAVREGAPLLLTSPGTLPDAVREEIVRLDPAKIVVVGGVNSVTPAVFDALEDIVLSVPQEVIRLAGADRYAASVAVNRYAFGGDIVGPPTTAAYVVTGSNFPDALSAGAAGASFDAPVILVYGPGTTAGEPVTTLLGDLGVTNVKIGGGVNSVTPSVEASIAAPGRTVERFAGADRFIASQNVNIDAFDPTTDHVYLATGLNYPDALAGAALAGKGDSPLYVVPSNCIPRGVLAEISRLGATKLTLLGGPNSLNASVFSLTPCGF